MERGEGFAARQQRSVEIIWGMFRNPCSSFTVLQPQQSLPMAPDEVWGWLSQRTRLPQGLPEPSPLWCQAPHKNPQVLQNPPEGTQEHSTVLQADPSLWEPGSELEPGWQEPTCARQFGNCDCKGSALLPATGGKQITRLCHRGHVVCQGAC